MISCVKSWDITEYSNKLFHDIPLSDKYIRTFGRMNRRVEMAKQATITRFDNLLRSRKFSVIKRQDGYKTELMVKPDDYCLNVVAPFNNGIIALYIGELRMKTTAQIGVPLDMLEREGIYNLIHFISKRFRSCINQELFYCVLNNIDVYTHNWNKKVYLERVCGN